MPGPSPAIPFAVHEDEDCSYPSSYPSLDAGAGQMGLTTHLPPCDNIDDSGNYSDNSNEHRPLTAGASSAGASSADSLPLGSSSSRFSPPRCNTDDNDDPLAATVPPSFPPSSAARCNSSLSDSSPLAGRGDSGTGSYYSSLPRGPVPGFNRSTYNPFRSTRRRQRTPRKTPRPRRYRRPPISNWVWKSFNPNNVAFDDLYEDGEEESDPLDGMEGVDYGARQQRQLPTPAETPEPQRSVDVYADGWQRESIEQDDNVAFAMQKDELPTPADTPPLRGFRDATAGTQPGRPPQRDRSTAPSPAEDIHCSKGKEGLVLAGDGKQRPSPPARRRPQPRDALGRFARHPAGGDAARERRRSSRVQKGRGRGRRRRRTEVELTMYHAIRWSGMGDVVPNVSVVTREPLVQMPLPCTFGEGPGGKGKEEEDFAVGLSRGLVREIERRWAERVRKTDDGC